MKGFIEWWDGFFFDRRYSFLHMLAFWLIFELDINFFAALLIWLTCCACLDFIGYMRGK